MDKNKVILEFEDEVDANIVFNRLTSYTAFDVRSGSIVNVFSVSEKSKEPKIIKVGKCNKKYSPIRL